MARQGEQFGYAVAVENWCDGVLCGLLPEGAWLRDLVCVRGHSLLAAMKFPKRTEE